MPGTQISTQRQSHQEEYLKTLQEANRLVNEESNRLITWSLSLIGGSILTVISSGYAIPSGSFMYTYALFASGWVYLSMSIYFGEKITRHYIAGATARPHEIELISQIGEQIDKCFARQIKNFKYGVITFSIWLIAFLIWFIISKL